VNTPEWLKPDPAVALRCEAIAQTVGPALLADARRLLAGNNDPGDAMTIGAADAASLVRSHGLAGIDELMAALIPLAQTVARPPISNFFVGVIGLERETGDLVIGGNIEFPGTNLGESIHGEQFVLGRAFSRGHSIERVTLLSAPPCGHCRQFLSEFQHGLDLVVATTLGHRFVLRDLLPWTFTPLDLGESGVEPVPPGGTRQEIRIVRAEINDASDVLEALVDAGRRAYVPYSSAVSAIALKLKDGSVITGSALESVAFNPSLGPLQIALINLIATGRPYTDIDVAVLGGPEGGNVDYAGDARNMLAKVTPDARFKTVHWERV
jgi:cytidine deaminase